MTTLTIPAQYNGPPDMANGGYLCGTIAAHFDGAIEVTLRAPTPLERPLTLIKSDETHAELFHQDTKLADIRTTSLALDPPAPPRFEDALKISRAYYQETEHPVANCFVCGPNRKQDGLRVHAWPVSKDLATAPWAPDEKFARADGTIDPAFIWAALDCPGATAVEAEEVNKKGGLMLLGKLAGEVTGTLRAREKCTVIAWPLGHDGRKHYAGTAVFNEGGGCVGKARATWIELK